MDALAPLLMKYSVGVERPRWSSGPTDRSACSAVACAGAALPAPAGAGIRGCHGDPQPHSKIAHRQFFYVAHHQHFAQKRRNTANLRLQNPKYFPPAKCALGISILRGQLGRSVPALGAEVINVDKLCPSPLADNHQTLVLDNSQKPCREFGLSLELFDVLECFPTRILRFFFCFAPMAKDGSGQIRHLRR